MTMQILTRTRTSAVVSKGVPSFALTLEGRVVWLDEVGVAYSLAVTDGGQIITRQPLYLPLGSCEPISYEAACGLLLQQQRQREIERQMSLHLSPRPHPRLSYANNRVLRTAPLLLPPPGMSGKMSARKGFGSGVKSWLPESGLGWLNFVVIVVGLFLIAIFLINNVWAKRGSEGGSSSHSNDGANANTNPKVVQGANGKNDLHYQVVRSGEYNPIATPTISCNLFERFLKENASPAAPQAGEMCAAIVVSGGDPAVALGFFEKESNFGKNGTTDAGNGSIERNMGNIRCNVGAAHSLAKRCRATATNGSFNAYDNWAEGAADWAKLLQFYKSDLKLVKLEDVLYKYAPWTDRNNPPAYVGAVKQRVDKLRVTYWSTK
jgi:hypothetical protein